MNFKSPKNSNSAHLLYSAHLLTSPSKMMKTFKQIQQLCRPALNNVPLQPIPPIKIASSRKVVPRKPACSLIEDFKKIVKCEPNKGNNFNQKPASNFYLNLEKKRGTWDSSRTPYSPSFILSYFSEHLTNYEKTEILNYKNIYYIDRGINKRVAEPSEPNNGFDDNRRFLILKRNNHVYYRYEILSELGQGSYGQVFKAYDHKLRKFIALKVILNRTGAIKKAKTEIKILNKLLSADPDSRYIVKIYDHCIFRSHVCIAFEFLDVGLHKCSFLSKDPSFLLEIKNIIEQILFGIKLYHSLGIIHCDLKPDNIMIVDRNVDRKTIHVKIIDFGIAIFNDMKDSTLFQTKHYQAPEMILEIDCDEKIDIWSLGCIVAELFSGYILFIGNNDIQIFLSFVEILGIPPAYMLEKSRMKEVIEDAQWEYKIVPGSKPLRCILPMCDAEALDFIEKCLTWDPNHRISAEMALKHDFFNKNFLTHTNSPSERIVS